MTTVQERGERLGSRRTIGGPVKDYERVGRLQLMTLLDQGLEPTSSLLDVGCGALRGGYWIMHFLAPGRYFGLEPNAETVADAIETVLEPGLVEQKQPTFDHNGEFDLSGFGVRFDVMLARSIWTHASKQQIERMLDEFVVHSAPSAFFLTSFVPTGGPLRSFVRARRDPRRQLVARDYQGDTWEHGVIAHDERWIRAACSARGLSVRRLTGWVANRQHWLRIERHDALKDG